MMRDVGKGDASVLDWEPARWTEDVLQRLAIESVKTMTVIAARVVAAPRVQASPWRAQHRRPIRALNACRDVYAVNSACCEVRAFPARV